MRLSGIITIILLNFAPLLVHAQHEIDSLKKVLQSQHEDTSRVNTLRRISWQLVYQGRITEAQSIADNSLLLATKLNFRKGISYAFQLKAYICYNQSNYSDAINYAEQSLVIMKEINDKSGSADAYQALASANGMLGNYAENLEYAYEALKIMEELKDKPGIANQKSELANIYTDHSNFAEGKKYALEGIKIFEEIKDTAGVTYCRNILSKIDYAEGNLSKALNKVLLNIETLRQIDSVEAGIYLPDNYELAGKIYEKLGDSTIIAGNDTRMPGNFAEAEKYYLLALKLNEKNNSKDFIAAVQVDLAGLNIKLRKFSVAKNYLQQGLALAKTTGYKNAIRDSYAGFSLLDSVQGNYKEAYAYYRLYLLYRDSILNVQSVGKSSEIQMKYAIDKRDAENKLIQTKRDADVEMLRNFQFTAIVIFLLICTFLYWNNRQKQKANRKIEKAYLELKAAQAQLVQSEKMASLGQLTAGIAHEIQNPLNFVNNFSDVNKELLSEMSDELNKGNFEEAKAIAKDIIDNEDKISQHGKRADSVVKGMLQHSKSNTGVKELTDINALAEEYLRLSYHGVRAKDKSFNAVLQTNFDGSIKKINIVPQDIGRVLLNLYNNAFYAAALSALGGFKEPDGIHIPIVWVSTKKVGDKILISVGDNGPGIPQNIIDKIFQPFFTTKPTGQGTGLGLSLSYDIVKAHGGEIKVNTKDGDARRDDPVGLGTEFVIVLPS